MAYKTYITEALVCGASDSNTADRSFLLFTREAGMLYASAKSVRKEESKHRYALQECSHVKVTLVRGKSGWKVIGTEPIENFYARTETREARSFLRDTILLLRRVLHGETAYPEIFDDLIEVFGQKKELPFKKMTSILTIRILNTLGYIAPSPLYDRFLEGDFPYDILFGLTSAEEEKCKEASKNALLESHL